MQRRVIPLQVFIDIARSFERYLNEYIDNNFMPIEKFFYEQHKDKMKQYIIVNMAKEYGLNYYDLKANI
jgi:hypothetical protein